MSQGSHSYDHELKVDSTTKGFNLIRNDNGAAMYSVTEDAPQQESQFKFIMRDWRGGHGQYEIKKPDFYYDGQSIDTTQEGKIILGPLINQVGISGSDLGANPVCMCWFSAISKFMVATASKVFWYDNTNFVEKKDFTAIGTISDMVEYNGVLYVALGNSVKYYTSTDGATYTITDLTDGYAVKFFTSPNAAGTSNVLWKFKTTNEISSTTNGVAGGTQWTSPAYIGDTSNNITNIFTVNDNLMIGRTDNLYHYDSDGGVHPLMDSLKHNRDTQNFKYVVDWQSAAYFSLTTGLGEITAYNTYQPVGPLTDIGDIGKVGTCVGLASDKDFLYVAMDEGTNTHIYKGREISREGGTRWEWCPWIFLSTNTCAVMKVVQHSSTSRRLWFGYGNYVGYAILSDNPVADTSYKFCASGFIKFSYIYGSNSYWDKLFQSVVTETAGCTTGISVSPKYLKDTDTSATALTASITSNGVVKTDLTTPLSCKRIQFELDLASNDNDVTPEVLYFEARGVEKPERIKIHEAVYAIGDTPSRKTETIRTFFRDARATTNLIRFADLRYGESTATSSYTWVVMVPGYPQEVEIIHEKGRAPELGIKCRFIEVNYATGDYAVTAADYATAILTDGSRTFTANQSMGGYFLTNVGSISYSATSEKTISSGGAIVPTQFLHTIDTYGDAASDDLDTITNTNDLSWVILRVENDARTVVIKHNTGNIWLQGKLDISLDDVEDGILLFYDTVNSKWFDVDGASITSHVAATDPHTGYRLESADHTHQATGAQAGKLDHGLALDGLTDDDHTQYLKEQMTENEPLLFDASISADGKYCGMCQVGTAAEALVFGNICVLGTDGKWYLADADTGGRRASGLGVCVLAASGDGQPTTLLLMGEVNAASLYPTLTIGSPVYLSGTAGNITLTPAITDHMRNIGYATSADSFFFLPSSDLSLVVDDTAGGVDGKSYSAASANALYDHGVATTGVHGVGAGTIAKTSDITATKLDDFTAPDDNTDLNASTSKHGLVVKATAPATNILNVVGIANGETVYTNKEIFDATNPAALGTAAPGTSLIAAHRDHVHLDPVTAHNVGLSSTVHPNTTYAKVTLGTTVTDTPDTLGVVIPLDTEVRDDGNNFSVAKWQEGACDAGSSATAIIDANPTTGSGFVSAQTGYKVAWHDGFGWISAVTNATTLVIVTVNGNPIDVGDTYTIYHAEYTVPTTGYYLAVGQVQFANIVADKRYFAILNGTSGITGWSASITGNHSFPVSAMEYLTAGTLVNLGALLVSIGATTVDIGTSYTFFEIMMIRGA